ncbi:MAG: NAD(P)/FAD-dependent oxidoreductase [bacterium]|nr:NAD(P)/FAD-dependent oxidoreductase [bacterium]
MRIAILGAGFTGLTAALRLTQQGHEVAVFEKESQVGGLAVGFSKPEWEWTLEKAYHHWFTSDDYALNLAKELNYPVIVKQPQTNVFVDNKSLPFDSPLSILRFPYLPFVDRIRMGLAAFYMKLTPRYQKFEGQKALPWIRKYMGEKATKLVWEPLFTGKFGDYKDNIALTWFWSRIKKRTFKLAYPQGGFQSFADRLAQEIENLGGKILLNTEISGLTSGENKISLTINHKPSTTHQFDKVIVTLPSPIFTKITSGLPHDYIQRISSIPHLHALNLILILKKPFLGDIYWLNVTDTSFPFLVLAEHTNFMDSKYYGNHHILYIGNYLPSDHPYLKMTATQLLQIFDPFLKQINPTYHSSLITSHLFLSLFAQPIVTADYPNLIPTMETPIKNVYLANMDMVYPWDRQTNYAMEMGEKVARSAILSERSESKDL